MNNTKVFKVELLIIDQNGQDGLDEVSVQVMLEQVRYLYPKVLKLQSVDIGEWEDSNPLNHRDKQKQEVERLFPET